MMLAPTELARRSPDAVAYRHDPLRLSLVIADLVAADGHQVSAHVEFGVRVVERAADLELFKEQFLNAGVDPRVSVDDVRARVANPLRASLAEFVSRHDAAGCLKQRSTIAALLLERANEIGFACGIEFVAPADVTVQSDSLAFASAKARAEAERHDDLTRSVRVAEMLRDVPAHLLPAQQQTHALASLLRGSAGPRRVMLVAGPQLAGFDPTTRQIDPRPTTAHVGPLRCVRAIEFDGAPRIAVGGQRGVAISDPALTFTVDTGSDRGFNSIALHTPTRRIIATHGELGIVTWNVDRPNAAAERFETPPQPRNLLVLDERLLFSAEDQVCTFDGQSVRPVALLGDGAVLHVAMVGERIVCIRRTGRVQVLDRSTLSVASTFDHRSELSCATTLTAGGLQLLVLAQKDGGVALVTLMGEYVAFFRSTGGPPRMLACAGEHLIGISSDRASLLLWSAIRQDNPPPQSISVLAPLGHRVADLIVG